MGIETKLKEMYALLDEIYAYHRETAEHSLRMAFMCQKLGPKYFNEEEVVLLCKACLVHDYGKLSVSLAILEKPGPLTPEEKVIMDTHSPQTVILLSKKHVSLDILKLAGAHHDPKGPDMTDMVAFLSMLDVYDAVSHKRCYSQARTMQETMTILRQAFAAVPFATESVYGDFAAYSSTGA